MTPSRQSQDRALEWRVRGPLVSLRWLRFRTVVKADDPTQPRIPSGNPGGGALDPRQ